MTATREKDPINLLQITTQQRQREDRVNSEGKRVRHTGLKSRRPAVGWRELKPDLLNIFTSHINFTLRASGSNTVDRFDGGKAHI